MATEFRLRRGTTAQHASFTGAQAEVTVDSDKKTLVVHDGVTAGGTPLAKDVDLTAHKNRSDNPHGVTKAQVGLGNVDNTSDANKPISTAVQTALNAKLTATQAQFDAKLAAADGPGGSHYSLRNKIINGSFRVWQRGTTFALGGVYTADRWYGWSNGGTTTVSRAALLPGEIEGESYCLSFDRTVAGSGGGIYQKIEDVRTFAGKRVAVSFTAKMQSANKTLTVSLGQSFGSGGSATVQSQVANAPVTTGWQRYVVYIDVPSIVGKTVGDNSYLELQIQHDGSVQRFFIAQVQVEEGTVATPFEKCPHWLELALCQRYYESNAYRLSAAVYASGYCIITTPFAVKKRTQPTVSWVMQDWNPSNGTPSELGTSLVVNGNMASCVVRYATQPAGYVGWHTVICNADAEL